MHTNMNFPAPIAVLGFLAITGGSIVACLSIVVALFLKKKPAATWITKVSLAALALYTALLLAFSLASQETALAAGEEKYFCEIDCHLAYSVVNAKWTGPKSYVVTLRTRFDETTTSATRPKEAPLQPNPRSIHLNDADGATYPLIATLGTPLTQSLKPGDFYTTQLFFEAPASLRAPRLFLISQGWEETLIIGSENSPLHKKTYFRLG